MPCEARKKNHERALKRFSTAARCRCTRASCASVEPLREAGPAACVALVVAFEVEPAVCAAVVVVFGRETKCVVVAVEVVHHGFVGPHVPAGIWRSGQNPDIRLTASSRMKEQSRTGVSAPCRGGSRTHPVLAGWVLFVSGPAAAEPIPQIANVEPAGVVPDFVEVVALTIRERIVCRVEEALDQIG